MRLFSSVSIREKEALANELMRTEPMRWDASAPIFPLLISTKRILEPSIHSRREMSRGLDIKKRLMAGWARNAPTLLRMGTISFLVYFGNSSFQNRMISSFSTKPMHRSLNPISWMMRGMSLRSALGADKRVSRIYRRMCSNFTPHAPLHSL